MKHPEYHLQAQLSIIMFNKLRKKIFSHRHKWQVRGINRYGAPTYRICLRCRKAQKWTGGIHGHFIEGERVKFLDDQFNEKDKYIF